MQAPPGAPGTARQGNTRIIMLVNSGGIATQPQAPGADVPPATPAEAPGQYRLRAALLAPGHDRPFTTSTGAAKHGRPRAATRAPGTDVPPAIPAEAPGQYRLRAALLAPGHDRPFTTSTGAAKHGRPRAATRAPGADVPPAIPAGAPGQYRLRAAPSVPVLDRSRLVQKAPGHGRPRAASSDVVRPDRPRATLTAPGADVPLACTAGAPGQHRPRAVAIATVALPAGPHRLRQEGLPHTPANPRTLTYSYSHHTISSLRRKPQSSPRPVSDHRSNSPSLQGRGRGLGPPRPPLLPLSTWWRGGRGVRSTSHQVHPAIQGPPHPRPCSTAEEGFLLNHPSRAPPAPCASLRRKPQSMSPRRAGGP